MEEKIKVTEKEKDYEAIVLGEKKYKDLIEANTNLKMHAMEVSSILSDYIKEHKNDYDINYEIIYEVVNDVSFASMVLYNKLYKKILNLKNSSDENVKKRIISSIENFVTYWLEKL